jgi:AP-4 complex subunit epsilon-1
MSSGSHLSKELFELVKSIGESRSKQEEDKIITQEAALLKVKIAEPNIPPKKMKEMLIRAIYLEMLGNDASFAYIHAINLTNGGNIVCKRVGYLTCGLCLPSESPLLILLVSNLQKDLQSPNYLEVSSALSAVCKLVNIGFLHAFSDQIIKLLSHSNEIIRKKAILVLNRFIKLNPSLVNEYSVYFRRTLCDKDPSVMGATLNSFHQILGEEGFVPTFKDLISSFVVILKQIIDHRLPRDFDYHRMPAPWLQICLLEILGILGENDKRASEQMYEILSEVMRRADDTGVNAGYAIIYQCLKTITKIYPNPNLIENAAQLVARFLTAENNNLKYTGITGLISIVKINPSYAIRHQLVVVDCLEDTDETLKRKTLILLYKMTNSGNVTVIIDKFNNILKSASFDSHLKQEIVSKVAELAEKFAPDSKWYLKTMNYMLEVASELIKPSNVNSLIKLIDEWREDDDIIEYTVLEYLNILTTKENVPDCIMQISAWVLGEFGDTHSQDNIAAIMDVLCKSLFKFFEKVETKGWILSALQKLCKGIPSDQFREMISRFSTSRNEDLQQRCYELAGTCTKLGSNIDFKKNLSISTNYLFLDNYVQQQLLNGASPYNQELNRKSLNYLLGKGRPEEYKASEALQSMRIEAYKAPANERALTKVIDRNPEAVELQVRNKVWSKQGYSGSTNSSNNVVEQPKPVQSFNAKPVQAFSAKPQPARPVAAKSEKDMAKEHLAQTLFGSFSPVSIPDNTPKVVNTNTIKKQPESLLDI